ncbi:hypothetical protein [Ramlibacter algicola]|uniref:Lytic transglycosylase domain-containing protein n=1 Tax=Ramlibacter algicola TaxID=2795217 RepID=A0A934Q2C7_9BURK|nr:hypothetical protein [Ramlibacter algicola]MBK0393661.1 hypothetical protein [Ramlibacter algicola]
MLWRVTVVLGTSAVAACELLALAGWAARPSSPQPVATTQRESVARAEIPAPPPLPVQDYYAQLRSRVRWEPVRMNGAVLLTPDHASRLMLAKAAAREARLEDMGLGFQDVYGLIRAETDWVPRLGASRDGTPNLGIAQFEPATAAALGVQDPDDVVEAVHAAARHMREAAEWSRQRVERLRVPKAQRQAMLRAGVSVYYNLSSRAREGWSGRDADGLPRETAQHIAHAREGAKEALWLARQLGPVDIPSADAPPVAGAQ